MSITLPPIPVPGDLLSKHYAYAVAYRLQGPQVAYVDFFEQLRAFDGWFNYTPNFWIVLSRIPMVKVAAILRSKIRTTDWLIVMPAKGPVDGWLPQDAWNWLNENLENEW